MDTSILRPLGLIVIIITAASAVFGAPYLEPEVFAAPAEELTLDIIIDYSYMASGLEGREKEEYTARFREFLAGLPKEAILNDPRPGEALLYTLHEQLFTRYSEPQTYIHKVFDTGVYNCVSSAVIYAVAGLSIGLDVEGVLTPDHAFCSVLVDGTRVDVETTTRYGYNPGEKREFVNAFGQTGFTYVPPGAYSLREPIGILRLISIILQNRVSILEKKSNYKRAVELSVERYALSPDEKAYNDLFTEFRNYASSLNQKGLYEEALEFIDDARALYGSHTALAGIIPTIVYNLAVTYSTGSESQKALDIVEQRYRTGDITEDERQESVYIIGDAVGHRRVTEAGDFAAASLDVDELYEKGMLPQERYIEFKVVLVTKEAELLYNSGETLKALHLVREAEKALGSHSYLRRAEYVFEHNAAVEIYNEAVEFMQKGDEDTALSLIEKGLETLPGNSILMKARNSFRNAGRP